MQVNEIACIINIVIYIQLCRHFSLTFFPFFSYLTRWET
jgi:hypothetical protein